MLSPRLATLGIRPLEAEEAGELHAVIEANREHLAKWMPWAAEQDLRGTERFVAACEEQFARSSGFQAAIRPEEEILGVAGFPVVDRLNRNAGIGYWLAEDAQGKGTMTTVVHALLDYAFYEWELHRVEIHCAPDNKRSRAIPERLGFREEARLRETELVQRRYLDGIVYGMLEPEWVRLAGEDR